jgi:hypothetical protein
MIMYQSDLRGIIELGAKSVENGIPSAFTKDIGAAPPDNNSKEKRN